MASLRNNLLKQFNKLKEWKPNFSRRVNRPSNTYFPVQSNASFDKRLVYSLSKSRIPSFTQLKYLKKYLSLTELWILRLCFVLFIVFSGVLVFRFYSSHLTNVPVGGGSYSEGMLGSPKYINPLYSTMSDVDSDLSHLIFSSLFKHDQNGNLVNDLVESYEIDKTNKIYTFKIKKNVKWHNGSPLTTDDILFTFSALKSQEYKSPLKQSYSGVEIEKVDDNTIKFTLPEPYAAFLQTMVFGILPQEIWSQIDPQTASLAELNLKPIGSGPYKFKSLVKDKSGNVRSLTLVSNSDYYLGQPKITNLTFYFYNDSSEVLTALNQGEVQGASYLPKQLEKEVKNTKQYNWHKLNLPQQTVIFFNPKNNDALAEKNIRQALSFAINKDQIINDILNQDARVIDGPIMPESFAYNPNIKKYNYNQAEAIKLLDATEWKIAEVSQAEVDKAQEELKSNDEKVKERAQMIIDLGAGKWRKKGNNYLIIKLTTVDRGENSDIINQFKTNWEQVGVKTNVELVAPAQIQSDVIKNRNFEALFYGLVVGSDPDPYAFWHSTQAGENGMNITGFSNKEVDSILEDARTNMDQAFRQEKYKKFQEILAEEQPAIFVYSPLYDYIQTKDVKGFGVNYIQLPYDRFNDITNWYIKTRNEFNWQKK